MAPAALEPALVGVELHHAYVTVDGALAIQLVSNPVSLVLAP